MIRLVKPDIIFHLAGEIRNEEKMFDSNIKLTYNLLEESKDLDYRSFIYVGSSSEYGRKNHPMSETDNLDPDTLYEATKGAGSLLCRAFAKTYNKPISIARPFSLYGKYESPNRFIPTIFRYASTGETLPLADGVHDWTYIDDFIDGLMWLMTIYGQEIVNFGTGIQTTNEEVVRIVEDILGKKIRAIPVGKLRSYDSSSWVAAPSKFVCKHTLKEGLEKCKEYFVKT